MTEGTNAHCAWTASTWRAGGPLDRIVERVWMVRGPGPFGTVLIPPSPSLQLVVNLGASYIVNGARAPDAWLEGVWERPCSTSATGKTWLVGVQFHPWAAPRFLGGAAGDCAGQVVDAQAVWGGDIRRLREQLFEAATDSARITVIGQFLGALHRPARTDLEAALVRLVRTGGRSSVDSVAHAVRMDVRTFRRRCTQAIGVSPKRLARLVRFDRAVGALSGQTGVCWAEFAPEHGFYDQAHLIREFRGLLGLTPADFVARRAAFGEYVVPIDESGAT